MCIVRIKIFISFIPIKISRMGYQYCPKLALFTPLNFSDAYRAISSFLPKLNAQSKILTIYHMQ